MIQAGCDERGPALPSEWGVAVSSGKAAWCRDSWNWADTGRGDSDYTIVTISTIDTFWPWIRIEMELNKQKIFFSHFLALDPG